MSLIDENEDQVLRMVEEGKLAWAWDVTLDPKRARSKELRILPACVADYLRGQACQLEWDDVLRLLLPGGQPVLLTTDIIRVLNVSSTHVYHLIRGKLLVASGSRPPDIVRFFHCVGAMAWSR